MELLPVQVGFKASYLRITWCNAYAAHDHMAYKLFAKVYEIKLGSIMMELVLLLPTYLPYFLKL